MRIIALVLLVALVAPVIGASGAITQKAAAQETSKVYPETLLLQLISHGKIHASNQVISILQEAAQLRHVNSTEADILASQAFTMLSNETSHSCTGLYRIAVGFNYTINKLIKLAHNLNESTKGLYNKSITQALYYLVEAKANDTKAINILESQNGNCTNGTASTVAHYLINTRNDISTARNMLDSLTACRFKQVIMKSLEKRLMQGNLMIQKLAMRKAALEQKGLEGPAMRITSVEKKFSQENEILMNTIREMNVTVNCTKLWITIAAFKMLYSYEIMQGRAITHFQNRAQILGKGQMHLLIIGAKLRMASNAIKDIGNNAGLPSNVKDNLDKISADIGNITKLYHEALIEAWTGSSNLNTTESQLESLINETRDLADQTMNMLPNKGFAPTKNLLRTVDRTLLMIENMVEQDFKGIRHAGQEIRMARELVYRLEVRTLVKDNRFALIIAERACNSTNNTVVEDLQDALQYATNAAHADNHTVAMSYLTNASNLVKSAENTAGTTCPEIQPVLIILEMEYNTTITILS